MAKKMKTRSQQTKLDSFLSPSNTAKAGPSTRRSQPKSSPSKPNSSPIKRYMKPKEQTQKKKGKRAAPARAKVVESDDSDSPPADPSDVEDIHFEPRKKRRAAKVRGDDSDSSTSSTLPTDPELKPVPAREAPIDVLSSPIWQGPRTRKPAHSSPPSSASDTDSVPSYDTPPPTRETRARKRRPAEIDVDEDEDEESPVKKKRRVAEEQIEEEDSEVEEVRDELVEELDPEVIIEGRLREKRNQTKSAFLKNLERLKRRRAGRVSEEESEEEEEEVVEPPPKPFRGARRDIIELDSDEDEVPDPRDRDEREDDEDAFIVDDDDEPAEIDLPAEYNMRSYQDSSHHFKVVCQLFTHLLVSAGDDRKARQRLLDTTYFQIPLNALRRSVGSIRESLVASSVWRPDFRKTLEDKPQLWLEHMSVSWPGCDACHFSSRISTIEAHLKGKKWGGLLNPDSPEKDSDESSSEDEDSEEVTYRVGRVCASRLKVYHDFSHWEYVLYEALQEQVELLRPKVTGRGRRPKRTFVHADAPDDPNDADAVMDWLDRKAVIATEWNRFKQMLESAQNINNMKPEDDIAG